MENRKIAIRVNWVEDKEIFLKMLSIIGFDFKTNLKVFSKKEGWFLNKGDKVIFCQDLKEYIEDCYDCNEFLTLLQLQKNKELINDIDERKAIQDIRTFCAEKRVLDSKYLVKNYSLPTLKKMAYDIENFNTNLYIMDIRARFNTEIGESLYRLILQAITEYPKEMKCKEC